MKTKRIVCSLLVAGLFSAWIVTPALAKDKKDKAKLEAKAKISKEEAQKTALAKVPDGTVKDAELEQEHGKLIWSFDIATPDSKDITEVNVDAKTGKVVSVDTETPEAQAKEKDEDARKEKDEDNEKD